MATAPRKHYLPPVIPEIAKAYENDPSTKLASNAIAAGTSTAPVAQGQYAYADGIARVLNGLAGAYMNKRLVDRYGAEEAAKVAAMNAQGAAGPPAAQAAPTAPQAAPAVPPATPIPPGASPAPTAAQSAAAGILNGGAPGIGGGMPGATPATPPIAPAPAASTGAGLVSQRPFPASPSGNSSAVAPSTPPVVAAPQPKPDAFGRLPVPDAPPPVDLQAEAAKIAAAAPKAVGATRSRLLDEAYKLMATGDRYDYAHAQDLLERGNLDQTRLDESAAERDQRIRDMGFQAAANIYASGAEADRNDKYATRRQVMQDNFTATQGGIQRTWESSEKAKDRATELRKEAMSNATALQVANIRAAAMTGTPEEQDAVNKAIADKRLDPMRVTTRNARILGQALLANPNLNAIQLHALATYDANPSAQQKASLMEALPTVVANARDAGKKLNYSDAQFVGKLQAWKNGQLNDPNFTAYMTQRNDALQTIAQVMGGTGASDYRTRLEAEAASPTMSPRALDAWAAAQITALHPRIAISERKGLIPRGTTAALEQTYGLKPIPGMSPPPAANAGTGKPSVSNW